MNLRFDSGMYVASYSLVTTHVPEVEEEKTPKMGMKFDTLEEAFDFYNAYEKIERFSVRKQSNSTKEEETI